MNQSSLSNSPAGDYWTLYIVYTPQNGTQPQYIPISYLPTGEIDVEHTSTDDLQKATRLLNPTIEFLELATRNASLDLFKVLNFVYVTDYWFEILSLGQLSPTTYNFTNQGTPIF